MYFAVVPSLSCLYFSSRADTGSAHNPHVNNLVKVNSLFSLTIWSLPAVSCQVEQFFRDDWRMFALIPIPAVLRPLKFTVVHVVIEDSI